MGFKHAHFSGPSKIYHASQLSLGWMNDIISSLIVFPRALGHPPGGFLREDSGYGDEECQFFPISELQAESVPLYPTIAGNVSNEAQDPLVSGELTNVGVYEHAGSRGNSAQFPGPGGIRHANLEDYQVREKVSSVPVAWTGPWRYEQRAVAPMVAISFAHDLRGTWRGEFGDLTYPIVQEGNRVGWYAERNHERATRTINGLHVSVSWAGDWGSGSDTGRSSLTPPSASSGLTGTTGMSSPDSTDRRRPGVCLRHVRWIVAAPWKHRRNRDPWTSGERRPDPRIDPRSCQFGQRAAIGIMRRLVGLGGGALSLGVEAAGPRAVSWRKQEGVNG